MIKEKKISVIVPVHNAEKCLNRCLQSIINQSYKNLEIILINDGSTDSSDIICKDYIKKDERIIYIKQDQNGVSYTRNVGLRVAKGSYIAFVDSDDFLEKDMYEKMMDKMLNNNSKLVICGYNYIDIKRNRKLPVVYENIVFSNFKEMKGHLESIYSINLINTPWNKLYRKDCIPSGFPEELSLGEDLLFNIAYLKQTLGNITMLSEPLYNYVNGEQETLTSRYRTDRISLGINLKNEVDLLFNELFDKNYNKAKINTPTIYLIQETIDFCCESKEISIKKKYQYLINNLKNEQISEICNLVELNHFHSKISNFLLKRKHFILLLSYHYFKSYIKNTVFKRMQT